MAKSSKGVAAATVGRPKQVNVHRQNVTGATGSAGRMKSVGVGRPGAFAAGTRAAKSAAKRGKR
jgi:hypothetical protein